jgi:hypothetical protein
MFKKSGESMVILLHREVCFSNCISLHGLCLEG